MAKDTSADNLEVGNCFIKKPATVASAFGVLLLGVIDHRPWAGYCGFNLA